MLGRKSYTVEELDEARAEVARQLATYKKVAKLAGSATTKVSSTLEEFEAVFFNNMALALVRRVRPPSALGEWQGRQCPLAGAPSECKNQDLPSAAEVADQRAPFWHDSRLPYPGHSGPRKLWRSCKHHSSTGNPAM